jgi:hypothetical protein
VAEGARLESVFTRKGNVGSNPTLSARLSNHLVTTATELVCLLPAYALRSLVTHALLPL